MAKPQFGLIGHHISYSKSPQIHRQINPNIDYQLIDVEFEEIANILHDDAFQGFNVTIPYKKEIIPLLDEIDPIAKKIGAINTISKKNQRLIGHNTDFDGFQKTLSLLDNDFHLALILGNGGASQAVQQVLINEKIPFKVVSRTPNKQNNIIGYDKITNYLNADLIINTTPLGDLNHLKKQPIDLTLFPQLKGVIDLIYNPEITPLLAQAKKLDIPCLNGETMLHEQAKKAQQFW